MSLERNIEKFWYSSSSSKVSSLIANLLWPINLILLLIVKFKYFLYNSNILKQNTFTKPVIVIGNISVGGTGKTPFIAQLVILLKAHGICSGVVSRGYKSNITHFPHKVTKNDNVDDVGDEAYMQCRNLNVPIVIDPNRSRAIEYLINNNEIDLVISDDGLQHYSMSRDLEFLLFDGERKFGNQKIIPIGPLREPISRLKTVDLILSNGETAFLGADASVHLRGTSLVNLKTGDKVDLTFFSDTEVNAIAGIGNPRRFFNTLKNHCNIKASKAFDDHHSFRSDDFDIYKDEPVIMTEKDAVKCFSYAKDNWYYLKVEMIMSSKIEAKILELVTSINNKK